MNEGAAKADPVANLLVVLMLVTFFSVLIWYLYSPYLAWGAAHTAIKARYLLFPFTFLMSDQMADFIQNLDVYLARNLDFANFTLSEFALLLNIIFRSLSVILVPLLLWRGISNIVFAKTKSFTRQLDLLQLAEIQASRYPRMKPPIRAKLLDQDHRFGPWATSRNPLQYLIHHKLVSAKVDPELIAAGYPDFNKCDEEAQLDILNEYHGSLKLYLPKVTQLLVDQLGKPCQYTQSGMIDIQKLPTIDNAMAVIFLAAITGKKIYRERVEKLLDQFGDTFREGSPATANSPAIPHAIDLSGVSELWTDIEKLPTTIKFLINASKKHAYWYSFMTALYQEVYDDYRTMSSKDFKFLKPINRTLFLLCNQVGLEMPRAETCGIRAHYLTERKHGAAILAPQVETQAVWLVEHIQNEGWLETDIVSETDGMESQLEQYNLAYRKDLEEFNKERATNAEPA